MEFLQTAFKIIDWKMEKPLPYGWFHLMFVGLTVLGVILLCFLKRNLAKKGKDTSAGRKDG